MEPLPQGRPLLWRLNWTYNVEMKVRPAELERRLGAPHVVDEEGDGLGPMQYWGFHCDCGLELVVRHLRAADLCDVAMHPLEPEHALAHLELRTESVHVHGEDVAPLKDGWAVVRQDDAGNRYDVGVLPVRAHAECYARLLEARAHKQSYYVEQRGNPRPLPGPGWVGKWAVIRQDEHGNREEMAVFPVERLARRYAESFESEPRHKQSFFVEPVTPKS